ncbi:hypothetical protein LINPERPRIM_LOCUS20412 [Linum perenne]
MECSSSHSFSLNLQRFIFRLLIK